MFTLLLYLINIIHICLVIFVLIVPFLNVNYYLLLHLIIVPFIIMHWITNNNICGLTVAEYYLREIITGNPVDRSQCFMARLIEPVYDFKKNNQDISTLIYTVTICLVFLSSYKLYRKWKNGEIKTFWDLLKK